MLLSGTASYVNALFGLLSVSLARQEFARSTDTALISYPSIEIPYLAQPPFKASCLAQGHPALCIL